MSTMAAGDRGDRRRLWPAAAVLVASTFLFLLAAPVRPAAAQEAPTGVEVEQGQGFATVSWDAVEGAGEYQIERTPLGGDQPTGPAVLVGRWLPDRYLGAPPDVNYTRELTFADSGFVLGERYRWRVRAVVNGTAGDWSEQVNGDTRLPTGPDDFLTGFELSNGASWTLHEDEVEVVEGIAAASDRVRLETIGETHEGRPMHLATVGYPRPPAPEAIADSPSVFIMCSIHGGERSGREACLMLLRELAFSDDPRIIDILSQATVLINPAANPDGQSVGRRTNTAGQDLNRDSLLIRHPETFAIAEAIRDYDPDLIVDAHEKGGGPDTDPSWPRSQIINAGLVSLSQDITIGRLFRDGAGVGWSMRPYTGWADNNWEGWHHNMAGMKNALGQLLETASSALPARPNAPAGSPQNMKRRVYTQLWSLHTLLDYHHENLAEIEGVLAASEAANAANEGPVYLDGAYAPPYDPPFSVVEPFTVELEPFCGYRLSPGQLSLRETGVLIGPLAGQPWTSATVEDRLAAHGVEVESVGYGIKQVLLAQPFRPMLPYLFDPELDTAVRPIGTPNLGMVDDARRLDDRRATVIVGDNDSGVPNRVDDISCSINDLIADEQTWPNHGRFVQHVNRVVRDRQHEGLLDNREAAAIRRTAAQSDIGH
jgi:Zinc carboxypeptidase